MSHDHEGHGHSHADGVSKRKKLFKIADNLIFPKFAPRYKWSEGIGSKFKYVGDGHEHSEPWSSLFLDLVFVAMCSKVTHQFILCKYSGELVVLTFCTFLMFYNVRFDNDAWMLNFGADDLKHRFFNFAYVFGVVVMVLNVGVSYEDHSDQSLEINGAPLDDKHHRALSEGVELIAKQCYLDPYLYRNFLGGFCISRACWLTLAAAAAFNDKSQGVFYQYAWKWIFKIIGTIVFFIGAFAVHDVHIKLYMLIFVACGDGFAHFTGLFSIMLVKMGITKAALTKNFYPMNYLVIQQRMAVFVLIVLGEGIISLLIPAWQKESSVVTFMICLFGLLLLYNMSMQFFDLCLRAEGEMHAMRRDMFAGSIFSHLVPFLGYFLLIMSGGMAILLVTYNSGHPSDEEIDHGKMMVTIGVGVSNIIMLWMRCLHKGFDHRHRDPKHLLHLLARCLIIVFHFLCLLPGLTGLKNLIAHSILSCWPLLFESLTHCFAQWFSSEKEAAVPTSDPEENIQSISVSSSADESKETVTHTTKGVDFWSQHDEWDEYGDQHDNVIKDSTKATSASTNNKVDTKNNVSRPTTDVATAVAAAATTTPVDAATTTAVAAAAKVEMTVVKKDDGAN